MSLLANQRGAICTLIAALLIGIGVVGSHVAIIAQGSLLRQYTPEQGMAIIDQEIARWQGMRINIVNPYTGNPSLAIRRDLDLCFDTIRNVDNNPRACQYIDYERVLDAAARLEQAAESDLRAGRNQSLAAARAVTGLNTYKALMRSCGMNINMRQIISIPDPSTLVFNPFD